MSKYNPLWEHVKERTENDFTLTFAQIESILGFPIDHSFLKYKKELLRYGMTVGKISIKNETVSFSKAENQ